MKKIIKYQSLINVIGLSIVSISLILFVFIKQFSWSELLIILNLLLSIPFIISGFVILGNIETINERKIQNTLITVFLSLWIPSIGLPFAYEVGGLLICLTIFIIGLFAVVKIKNTVNKMILMNVLGTIFLIVNCLLFFEVVNKNL